MAQLTPLSKGLLGLLVLGCMASAAWHLGFKDRFGNKPTDAEPPALTAPQATSSEAAGPSAAVAPAATPAEKPEPPAREIQQAEPQQPVRKPQPAAPVAHPPQPQVAPTGPAPAGGDPWADLKIDKKGNKP
ncbi:MAG: hypothetical protein JZU64_15740 [Rhodoferax sp.]|jgi:hypothetical protein|nr:hypothetical protein [Rhodoferax sp.]